MGHVQASFNVMRIIVTAGWSIYPLGYFFGYLLGAVNDSPLNLVYNIADFVNKIAFCLAIWQSASKDSAARKMQEPLLPCVGQCRRCRVQILKGNRCVSMPSKVLMLLKQAKF